MSFTLTHFIQVLILMEFTIASQWFRSVLIPEQFCPRDWSAWPWYTDFREHFDKGHTAAETTCAKCLKDDHLLAIITSFYHQKNLGTSAIDFLNWSVRNPFSITGTHAHHGTGTSDGSAATQMIFCRIKWSCFDGMRASLRVHIIPNIWSLHVSIHSIVFWNHAGDHEPFEEDMAPNSDNFESIFLLYNPFILRFSWSVFIYLFRILHLYWTCLTFFATIAGCIDAILRNVDVAGHVLTFVAGKEAFLEAFLLYSGVYKFAAFADASCKPWKCKDAEIVIPKRHCGKASRLRAFEPKQKKNPRSVGCELDV